MVTVETEAHLGDMVQELGAGEAVLCGTTVCTVVEKTKQCRVQLKQSKTDKHCIILQVSTHGMASNTHSDTKSACN